MAIANRVEFIDYIRRNLGEPVIELNIDDGQVEDRVDDAIKYFHLHHYNGTVKLFTKHTITQADIDNEYITVANPVQDVIKVYQNRAGAFSGGSGLFSQEFQFHLNNVETLTGGSVLAGDSSFGMIDFAVSSSYLSLIESNVTAEKTFMFNSTQNKLYIMHNWATEFSVGEIIVIELWSQVDPVANPEVYEDKFLIDYATALIKRQWGANMSKFDGVVLPGGITMNGRVILEDAKQEIEKLEEEMLLKYSLPPEDIIG